MGAARPSSAGGPPPSSPVACGDPRWRRAGWPPARRRRDRCRRWRTGPVSRRRRPERRQGRSRGRRPVERMIMREAFPGSLLRVHAGRPRLQDRSVSGGTLAPLGSGSWTSAPRSCWRTSIRASMAAGEFDHEFLSTHLTEERRKATCSARSAKAIFGAQDGLVSTRSRLEHSREQLRSLSGPRGGHRLGTRRGLQHGGRRVHRYQEPA